MSNHFEVGEIATYWRPISRHHRIDVTIESALERHLILDTVTGAETWEFVHAISFPPGTIGIAPYGNWCAAPHELRKRRDWISLCDLVERKNEVEA